MYCRCGKKIEQARLDATNNNAKTCISCMHNHDVARKTGFMVRDHKMAGQIEIHDDPAATAQLYALSSRKGYGVSRGAMFRKDAKTQSNQL
jgi:hypothetical protein